MDDAARFIAFVGQLYTLQASVESIFVGLEAAAGICDILFFCSMYKFTYLLTYYTRRRNTRTRGRTGTCEYSKHLRALYDENIPNSISSATPPGSHGGRSQSADVVVGRERGPWQSHAATITQVSQ